MISLEPPPVEPGFSQQVARLSSRTGITYGRLEYVQSTQLPLSRYHSLP